MCLLSSPASKFGVADAPLSAANARNHVVDTVARARGGVVHTRGITAMWAAPPGAHLGHHSTQHCPTWGHHRLQTCLATAALATALATTAYLATSGWDGRDWTWTVGLSVPWMLRPTGPTARLK